MCADRHLLRTIWAVIMLGALLMDYRNQVGARTFRSAVMNRCMKADDPKTPESVSGIAIINLLKRIAICAALTSVRNFSGNHYSTLPEPATGLQFSSGKKVDKMSPPRVDPWWSNPSARVYSPYRWRI